MNEYKSVFISDVHLGTKMCQADKLLDFIKSFECDRIYLVGDIVDCWALKSNKYWPQSHNDVIQKLLRKARKGTEIIYIPGNHDEMMREYGDFEFGHILLCKESTHISQNGQIYLVTHGDQFDVVINHAKWLAHLGSWAYDMSILFSMALNRIRTLLGLPYWSLSSYLKQTVKSSVNFIGGFEETLSNYVKSKRYNGIICGHIHHANMRDICGIKYMNCGDWVESCTALVEHKDGSWEIIEWPKQEN
jgi:UDP-2,3-diacylglucosamine pyrophosphatase LpxH